MNFEENKIIKYDSTIPIDTNNSIENTDAINNGKKILEGNDFLKELSDLMENKKFKSFFNKYMNDFIGIKSTITYMKLYNELKKKYSDINDEELDKNIVVFLLTRIIRNRDLLPMSIKTIDEILMNDKLDFFQELERKIKLNNLKNNEYPKLKN